MARFIIAHRLAGRQSGASKEQSRAAVENVVAGVRAFADVSAQPSVSPPRHRGMRVIDADAHEIKSKVHSFPENVIVEPEMVRVPARFFSAAAVRVDPSVMPASTGATFHLNAQCGETALRKAQVVLTLTNLRTYAGSTVAAQTDESGAVNLPYDPGFWAPTSVIVIPASGAWSWLGLAAGREMKLNLPGLPKTGPLGWWHHVLNQQSYSDKNGNGIRIGMADTGVSQHPYLDHVQRIGAFVNGGHDASANSTEDISDHGTHVAGIIGARPREGSGDFAGIAPGADLFCARVYGPSPGHGAFPQPESANNGDVAIAIDALVNEHRVDLINLSLGGLQSSQVELDAIQAALEAGVLVICSAGNESGGPVTYPAAYAQCVSVSAVGIPGCCPDNGLDAATTPAQSDRYSFTGLYSPTFVSVGPAINYVGPGVAIISTVPGASDGSAPYAAMSGTSMAAPAVCAALATVLSRDQTYLAMPRDIHRAARAATLLFQSCRDLGLSPQYQGLGLPGALP